MKQEKKLKTKVKSKIYLSDQKYNLSLFLCFILFNENAGSSWLLVNIFLHSLNVSSIDKWLMVIFYKDIRSPHVLA
jgi:hypothetical protein